MFSALQTFSFIVMGRIHDTTRDAYLKKIMTFSETRRKRLSIVAERFDGLATTHADLIERVLQLRNNVFAHTGMARPEHIVFGFEGLTWDQLETYWRDIAGATESLENGIFSRGGYGPKFKTNILDEDIKRANQVLDSLLVSSGP
jgi:hypothetical protein